jgi:hypothetical protein
MGHGRSNSVAEASKGTKATELLTLANEIRTKDVSHRIPKTVNAMIPFQNALRF